MGSVLEDIRAALPADSLVFDRQRLLEASVRLGRLLDQEHIGPLAALTRILVPKFLADPTLSQSEVSACLFSAAVGQSLQRFNLLTDDLRTHMPRTSNPRLLQDLAVWGEAEGKPLTIPQLVTGTSSGDVLDTLEEAFYVADPYRSFDKRPGYGALWPPVNGEAFDNEKAEEALKEVLFPLLA